MLNATQRVLTGVKEVLANSDELTQKEIWDKLSKDRRLKTAIFTSAGHPRFGVLQGLLGRVVCGKVPGLIAIVDDFGTRKYK
ncbi:hypothetical protein [Lactiplantibacillus modestisalitolerans]|uniref:Uncharacterized protein n=1 Tax=Lactiplantibacillus modestisalitolerans TaxID=1457219 RepID=A0ABV5WQW4_9LACO|nr:hypothetical protein [Lactiplantibacillus modestisalitolerans]